MPEVFMPTVSLPRYEDWRVWHPLGACANQNDLDKDAWFDRDMHGLAARKARAICVRCPVRQPCLDYALENPEEVGIWGGTDEHERRDIRRRQRGWSSRG